MFYVVIQDLIKKEIKPEEMEPHKIFVKNLIANGKMVISGPFTDWSGGMLLIEADNPEQANEIAENDPAVLTGILKNNIREFDISFLRQETQN